MAFQSQESGMSEPKLTKKRHVELLKQAIAANLDARERHAKAKPRTKPRLVMLNKPDETISYSWRTSLTTRL